MALTEGLFDDVIENIGMISNFAQHQIRMAMIDPKPLDSSQSPYLWREVFISTDHLEVVFWFIIIREVSLTILMLHILNLEKAISNTTLQKSNGYFYAAANFMFL